MVSHRPRRPTAGSSPACARRVSRIRTDWNTNWLPTIDPPPRHSSRASVPLWGQNRRTLMSEDVYYTLGVWHVKPGAEEAFIAAWKELGTLFMGLPQQPGPGTLVQSIDQPQLLYSFG